MEFLIITGIAVAFFVVVIVIDKLMSKKHESEQVQEPAKPSKPKRARTKRGRYKADDPSTPNVNEAWVGGKAPKPKKKKKTTAKKKASSPKSKKTS